jgi:hypothetical protein
MSNPDIVNPDVEDDDVVLSVEDFEGDDDDIVVLDPEESDGSDETALAEADSGQYITVTQRNPATGQIEEHTIDLSLPPLNPDEAREITEKIKHQSNQLFVLVKRAHAGRAWEALGYSGFAEYVRREFGTSTSWAYRLLSQANVIEAIEARVPEGTKIELGEPVARSLKKVLPNVLADIEERTAELDPASASAVVGDVISDHLAELERQEQEEAEEAYEGTREYDTPYNPDYEYQGDGEEEDEEPEVQADRPDPAQLLALRKNLEGLFNLYSGLKSLADVGDAQTIIPHIRVDRRNEFTSLLDIVVPWVADFQAQWTEYLQQVEVEEQAALDSAEDLDELDELGDDDDYDDDTDN